MRATSLGHAGILVRSRDTTIVCDPWFIPAFHASWFPFPRNDRLSAQLMADIRTPTYLYVSHLHGDHFDEEFLRRGVDPATPVLLPDFPTDELERRFRQLGFETFIRTRDGEEIELAGGVRVAIHVESSITDGPGGDSAIVISDDTARLVNQNDCRTDDLAALAAHGPVDMHWLQFSGAIWYPMVYDVDDDTKRRETRQKVESQFTRALRYVEAVGARCVVPSAGPPCFLDPDLFGLNVVTGEEISIFPDQTEFLRRLPGENGVLNVPGTTIDIVNGVATVSHSAAIDEVRRPFDDKAECLREYQRDWLPWIRERIDALPTLGADVVEQLRAWWEPLLALAPSLRLGVGAGCLIRSGGHDIFIDFPNGTVRAWNGETHRFRFDIPPGLLAHVVATHAVDWSNSLFLSCRFVAWREGAYNEHVYNFFKSLSPERMRRANEEAKRRLGIDDTPNEEIVLGDYVVQRYCPHRKADLSVFGAVEGNEIVCSLHGWRFSADDGRCLNAEDRRLKVRRRSDVD
jgi:UDP-MurNAc hydroxylase